MENFLKKIKHNYPAAAISGNTIQCPKTGLFVRKDKYGYLVSIAKTHDTELSAISYANNLTKGTHNDN